MAKSIVAGVATEKAAPRLVRHCARCGEQELFCWCDVERKRADAMPSHAKSLGLQVKRLKKGTWLFQLGGAA